jgi:hypothetical protein
MGFYTLQQTIATVDNTAANYATNTWHFEAEAGQDITNAQAAIQAFYVAISDRFGNIVRQNNHPWKIYDDTDPEPRAPISTGSFNLPVAPSLGSLPPEVTLVLSFQAVQLSGVPQARRRGRVFIPFLQSNASGSDGRPVAAVITDVRDAANTLLSASNSAAGWTWLTFSRVAPGYATVVNGWVDNEWDTQRRRGRVPTSRTVWP